MTAAWPQLGRDGAAVPGEACGAPADVAVVALGWRRPGGVRPIFVRIEAGLDDLDEQQVRGDQCARSRRPRMREPLRLGRIAPGPFAWLPLEYGLASR
jgi:hypothetical protein